MKWFWTTTVILFLGTSAFSQGYLDTIEFANVFIIHIYGPDSANPSASYTGNTSADTPVGSTSYANCPLLGGGSSGNGYDNGNSFSAEFFETPGDNQLYATIPVTSSLTHFGTVTGRAGWLAPVANGCALLGTVAGGSATVQLRAWYNEGGTISTWDMAVAAGVPLGESPLCNVDQLGGNPPGGGIPIPDAWPRGLQSFNIHMPYSGVAFNISPVPEPSTVILGGAGALAFLICRREKL